MMEIFDCHLHVEKGLQNYDLKLAGANIIFNSIESYNKFSGDYPNHFHSLIFDFNIDPAYYNNLIKNEKIRALKIHTRLQKITVSDHDIIIQKLKLLETNIPVIYDAFYYGYDMEFQPSLSGLLKLIKEFPDKKFIIAHSGGYEVLKYFFHLKGLENVGFDLSFSLQYLVDSSCKADMIKLIKYIPSSRLFFGTDFPAGAALKQKDIFMQMTQLAGLANDQIIGILTSNWIKFTEI